MKSKYYLFLILLFPLINCQPTQEISKSNTPTKPNIIILFADDMGYGDMTNTGHPTIHTPNLDKMAANGMKFTNFYSGSPACSASRYALLTGKYPVRSGFGWVLYPKSKRGIHSKEITIAEGLKNVGYATACYGKWHLGSTKKEFLPLQNGFDKYIGLPYSNDMIPPKWEDIPLFEGNDTIKLNPNQDDLTHLYTSESIKFIKDNAAQKKPFFLYLPYAMPHIPLHASKDFKNKSKRGKYGDTIEEIDWSVGVIIEALKSEGILDNTLIFFTSDNGPWIIKGTKGGSSGLFRDGKGSTWEGGMRVPAIAYWNNNIPKGSINMNLTSTLDLINTSFDLAGVSQDDYKNDGKSLVPLFKSPLPKTQPKPFFYYGLNNKLLAVRKDNWKLHIKTYSQTQKKYFEDEMPLLFDINIDPSENHNLAKKHPKVVEELLAIIKKHQEEVKATGNYWE